MASKARKTGKPLKKAKKLHGSKLQRAPMQRDVLARNFFNRAVGGEE